MSNIGLMEGAFFVGRKEIMEWVNGTLDLNLAKVEDTASGAVACQVLDIMYPGQVPMHKVNWSAKQAFEFIANYKILQTAFTKLGIERHVDVDRLITGRYMDNLEFLQWYKAYYERNVSDKGDYDAFAQRSKGKGGAQYGGGKTSNSNISKPTTSISKPSTTRTTTTNATTSTTASTTAAAVTKVAPSKPKTSRSTSDDRSNITKENAVPNRQAANPNPNPNPNPSGADPSKYLVEIQSLKEKNKKLENTNEELRAEMDGMEKERDFYFEKLRDIEIILQELEDSGNGNELTGQLFKILYATAEGFEPVEAEQGEASPVDLGTCPPESQGVAA